MVHLEKRSRFGDSLAAMGRSLVRFPLPMVCGVLFAAVNIGAKHTVGWLAENKTDDRLMAIGFLGFFLTLAIALFAEARGWSRFRQVGLAAVALACLVWRVYVQSTGHGAFSGGLILFLAPAFILLTMAAPFVRSNAADAGFWEFNRAAWSSAAFGLLVAVVLGTGLSAGYKAVEMLFGVNLSYRLFENSWVLCLAVLWPWQALAGVPERFDAPDGDYCPRWVEYLATYFLVPFVAAYVVIILAYIVKILVAWDLPKGEVAYVVAGYVGFGVATYLVTYPMRDTGNRLIQLFQRYFLKALFVPAALMAVAVGLRIDQYGVTEARYILVAFAAWLVLLASYSLFSRRCRLLFIPVTAALILLAGSTGPWGAQGVSVKSQLGRLEGLLRQHGLLEDGRISPNARKAARQMTRADRKRISSAVRYLVSRESTARLRPWFDEETLDFRRDVTAKDIVAAMQIKYVPRWENTERHRYVANHDRDLDVAGFRILSRFQWGGWKGRTIGVGRLGGPYRVAYDPASARMTVTDAAGVQLRFDLRDLAKRLEKTRDAAERRKLMVLDASEGSFAARLYVEHLYGLGDVVNVAEAVLLIR